MIAHDLSLWYIPSLLYHKEEISFGKSYDQKSKLQVINLKNKEMMK